MDGHIVKKALKRIDENKRNFDMLGHIINHITKHTDPIELKERLSKHYEELKPLYK